MRAAVVALILAGAAAFLVPRVRPAASPARAATAPCETYEEGTFAERAIEVEGGRVRLAADTRGVTDHAVHRLGVRRAASRVEATIDMRAGENASGLTAALQLEGGDEFLRVEYVGVPPGRALRRVISSRGRTLDVEGWPEVPAARAVKPLRVAIDVSDGLARVVEDGALVFEGRVSLRPSHARLEMTTRSNYPMREIAFRVE